MLGSDDTFKLIIINTEDIDGNELGYRYEFPLDDSFVLPKEVMKFDVCEYNNIYKFSMTSKLFTAYVCHMDEFRDVSKKARSIIVRNNEKYVDSYDKKVCYYFNEDGSIVIFKEAPKGDAVYFGDHENANAKLIDMSRDFSSISNSINGIKTGYQMFKKGR